tara:strand:- start:214 stop:504 length:291 start_codon:yes stop_codon:yes gene_type:complete
MDKLNHIAINVKNINESIEWYVHNTDCIVEYSDETWALIAYDNCKLALTVAEEHPPHICFEIHGAETFGKLKEHRDGTKSVYIKDPSGNTIEMLDV